MVLIKNLTQSQINGVVDNFRGEVVTNADTNKLMFNTGTEFTYLVYSDLNNIITGLAGIEATNITGTLQTAAQPNVTSLGTLTGLTVNNNLSLPQHNGIDKGLTLGGELVTSSAEQLNYVNTTPGTAEANKALVLDENLSIVGLSNLETDNLTVNGTLVTSSAIELNYVDVDTLGIAQASKALVVDADRNITNINTLEADFIQVNGTLVTSSAIELNYVDVDTLGVAQASKAVVLDANRNISNLNDVTAVNLTGTLQTAAQPNITSVGDLTGLNVDGVASVDSLIVNGVPLDAFKLDSLKMRVYSTPDFSGRVIKADIIPSVDFTNYEPVTGVTENYSMEIWGYIKPLYTESYTFTVTSNDKFRLWVNNEMVRADWTEGDDTNLQTSPIALTAGKWYPLYIQHSQLTGTERLSFRWSSATQVSQIVPSNALAYDDKALPVIARKTYTQDSITLYDSANTTLSTIGVNGSGDITITSASNIVNVAGHNGVDQGLKLDNVLVTSTAVELNYVDTTVGSAAANKAVVLNADKDYAGVRNITTIGNMGVNTTTPSKQMEINSSTGDVLRLTRDAEEGNAVNYADMTIDADGKLTINSSGDETIIHSSDNFNIAGHNGSTLGLKLNGTLVTSTAVELNYVDTTPGTAEASKALVLSVDRNISNINSLTTSTLSSVSTADSTSVSTGSITTAGGVGIAKNLNVGGVTELLNTANATNADSGALVVAGGAGIKKALYVGEEGSSVTTTTYSGRVELGDVVTNNTPAEQSSISDSYQAIAWSPTLNLHVASGLKIFMSSSDGINWNYTTVTNTNAELTAIEWFSELNKFIAVGREVVSSNASFVCFTSTNGTTWTRSTDLAVDGSTNSVFGQGGRSALAYSSSLGRVVAMRYNVAVYSDNGGSTWTESRMMNKRYLDIVWVPAISKFIAVGDNIHGHSADGITWTHYTSTGYNLAEITYSPSLDKIVARGLDKKLYITTDGVTWSALSSTLIAGFENRFWSRISWVASLNQFVAIGRGSNAVNFEPYSIAYSSDGLNWTLKQGILDINLYDFSYDSNLKRMVMVSSYSGLGNTIFTTDFVEGTAINNTVITPADGYFNLKGDADILGGIDVDGIVNMNNVTQSTNISTGALVVDGGVGIAKNLNIGQTLTVTGDAALSANVSVTGPSLKIPVGNTAARPTGQLGQVRYNSETSQFEGFGAGNTWGSLGGVTDVDQDTKILAETAAGADNDELRFYNAGAESMRLTNVGLLGLGTTTPSKKLEINSSTGDVLRLTYDDADGSAVNYADMTISSDGKLTINSSGDETVIHSSDNFNVAGHNGSTLGLKLADVLVTATAAELNYVDTTPGTAEASKALVLDSSRNIANINNLSATGDVLVVGDVTTSNLLLSSADEDDYASVLVSSNYVLQKTSTGFQWNTGATSSAPGDKIMELDTTLSVTVPQSLENITDSTTTTTGALVVAGGVGIAKSVNVGDNLFVEGNVDVDGPSLRIPVGNTLARPVGELGQIRYNSETSQFEGYGAGNSWGSLGGVSDVDQDTKILAETAAGDDNDELRFYNAGAESMRLTSTGLLGLGTSAPAKKLEINSATGDVLRLTYNDTDGSAVNYVDMNVSSSGNLTINSVGLTTFIKDTNNFDIAGHNGSTLGLKLAGVLVTSTAAELNYVDTTPGTAEASKALVLNGDRNISNINSLSTSTLTSVSTDDSTSVSTGAITTAGGVGIAKNLNVGGIQTITNLTNATSATSGALIVSGGAGIKKALYVGESSSGTTITTNPTGVPVGTSWVNVSSAIPAILDQQWKAIDWSPTLGRYVAISNGFSSNTESYTNSCVATSADGVAWTLRTAISRDWQDVKWVSYLNKFVAIGKTHATFNEFDELDGVKFATMSSPDGITWTEVTTPTSVDGQTHNLYDSTLKFSMQASSSKIVVVGGSLSLSTADGLVWTETRFTSKNYKDVSWSSSLNRFVAVGYDSNVGYSTDGASWTHATLPESGEQVSAIAWSNSLNKFIALSQLFVFSSSNGITWTATQLDSGNFGVWQGLQWIDTISKFVAVGENTRLILSSSTGSTWAKLAGNLNTSFVDFAYSETLGRAVAVSTNDNDARFAYSDDNTVIVTESSASDGYFNLKGDADILGGIDVEGVVNMNNVTQSTSSTTGALVVDGGVGIAKNLNVGEEMVVSGDVTLSANVDVDGPSLRIPVGNTTARPVGVAGQIRYNSETSQFEGFGAGNAWGSLGGVTDVDQDTRISAETAAGDDNDELRFYNAGSETMRLTSVGLMGLGTSAPAKKLEINSATGDVLRLTYNDTDGTAANYADMTISADGKLTINSSGDETIIHSSDNFNIAGHNGSTLGLKLAGTLVTATAVELNYVDTTPGAAEASKALVLDSARDINNINVLTADTINVTTFGAQDLTAENINTTGNVGINTSDLTFGLQVNHATGNVLRLSYNDNSGSAPVSRADFTMDDSNNLAITASNSVNIAVHNGTDKGLKLNNVLVTSTAAELNYVDTTPGTAEASKALVLNSSKDIVGINSISMNNLNLTFDSATVDTVGNPLTITRTTSGTPANGLGVGMDFKIENSANSNVVFGTVGVVSADITSGSEDGHLVVNLMTNGVSIEAMRLTKENLFVEGLWETSDRRVKENFAEVSLQETYDRIMDLKLTKYNYINQDKTHTGLIAQEVEKVIPVAVNTENRNGIEDFKSVSNREITNTLLGAVQYLAQKLENLTAEFQAYKEAHH